MALKLTKDFSGVVFAPRKEEIKPGAGVLRRQRARPVQNKGRDGRLIQLAPTQMNPVLLQVSYGIGVMETEEG